MATAEQFLHDTLKAQIERAMSEVMKSIEVMKSMNTDDGSADIKGWLG